MNSCDFESNFVVVIVVTSGSSKVAVVNSRDLLCILQKSLISMLQVYQVKCARSVLQAVHVGSSDITFFHLISKNIPTILSEV